jgi:squalene-associated FAD-dependent desaturase
MATVHVIGAGLAGLNSALRLAERGVPVRLYETSPQAGGRCRSYHDPQLDRLVDNGNHLVFAGNHAAQRYLRAIGAVDRMIDPGQAVFPFLDAATGQRWTVRLNDGKLPWWTLSPARRVPGTRAADYLTLLRFRSAAAAATVTDVVPEDHPLFHGLVEPFAVAVLNTAARQGSARLLWPVIVESFGQGGDACRPLIARVGLSHALVDPALERLRNLGVEVAYGQRLRSLAVAGDRIAGLEFAGGPVALESGDSAILAVPYRVAGELVPGLRTPTESRAIVNGHFRLPGPVSGPEGQSFLAIVSGIAQWLFFRGDVISATVSAADALAETDAEEVAGRLWQDVALAINRTGQPLPRWRIVKEKNATFAQTPSQVALRPSARTAFRNLLLAGDWTDTGLPATIEGSLRSGETAASLALAERGAGNVPIARG